MTVMSAAQSCNAPRMLESKPLRSWTSSAKKASIPAVVLTILTMDLPKDFSDSEC